MKESVKQLQVDDLISHFWRNGYLTIKRKYGKYLPEPSSVGQYNVDAIGKQKKKYAIGILLTEEELQNPKVFDKLEYLATRHTKYTNKRVTLFVGVPKHLFNNAKLSISKLSEEAKKSIKLVSIRDNDKNKFFN